MKKTEVLRLLALLKVAYPRFFVSNDKAELELQAGLWQELLGDIPLPVLQVATKKLILESPFPPTISDVRRVATEIMRPRKHNMADAWGETLGAIRKYGQYRPDEAMASLSPLTAKVVRAMGFIDLCLSENAVADRAHFLRMYEEMATKELKETALPDNLRVALQTINEPRALVARRSSWDKAD
ncbi:MAG: hypothetical protein KGZ50_07945 [Peptococcaceae bacterium]|nr:hypothetical protein [Peptococcaceae bacterium]